MCVQSQLAIGLEPEMQWTVREHSDADVNRAGEILASPDPTYWDFNEALAIINNWRSSHHFPLNTFQTTLRRKADQFADSVVVQRVKRLQAIRYKLRKHTKKPIPLSEMQDIGGCRAVCSNAAQAQKLRDAYLGSDLKHTLVCQNDYIAQPKYSGYRGIHLVYSYKSDKKETYNGLKIEVQLRSQLQHAWATAVEIVGFFRKELLKSSEGSAVWKHFFKLMAAEIAFTENAPFAIPGISGDRVKLRDEISRCAAKLDALAYLRTIGQGLKDVEEVNVAGAHYYLLELDTVEKHLKITGYKLGARARASMDYAEVERTVLGSTERDAVLVSAESMSDLKRAYVNYFFDMHRFVETVNAALGNSV